ncbi:MAG TPA: tetratricopeptide repeat protein [Fimbriimonadaceae bacterium]|nr:tetratricopeptide repeat protein [Fimbriimonadaceae bacterium]
MDQIPEAGDLKSKGGIRASAIFTALGLGMIVCAGLKVQDVRPIVNPPIRDENLDVGENNASVSLMGQFRSTASAWLWLRADLYLHNGVEMRPISDEELNRGVSVDNARDDGHEKLHAENEITSVPSKERDFRGIFGDVERQVASYQDMHNHVHNDPVVAMPLYRLMTWLDPQFVQGWTMGGMILARDRSPDGTKRSVDFLKEGWKANPTSVDIPSQIGYTIARRTGNLDEAVQYLEAARKLGRKRERDLADQEREGLRTAYRFLALCYRDEGKPELEKSVLEEGVRAFPDDLILPKLLSRCP